MRILTLPASLALVTLLAAGPALPVAPDRDGRARYCRQHPEDCTDIETERRAQLREWCEDNPVDCDEERQAALERRDRLARNRHARQDIRNTAVDQGRRTAPAGERDTPPIDRRTGPPR